MIITALFKVDKIFGKSWFIKSWGGAYKKIESVEDATDCLYRSTYVSEDARRALFQKVDFYDMQTCLSHELLIMLSYTLHNWCENSFMR